MQRNWDDPDWAERQRKIMSSDDVKLKQSKVIKLALSNPEVKERISIKTREAYANGAKPSGANWKNIKREMKLNPFSGCIERMDSQWESKFLQHCIDENIHCIKYHDIVIQYFREGESLESNYFPDFLLKDYNIVVEVKGRRFPVDYIKKAALEKYCSEHSMRCIELGLKDFDDFFKGIT